MTDEAAQVLVHDAVSIAHSRDGAVIANLRDEVCRLLAEVESLRVENYLLRKRVGESD